MRRRATIRRRGRAALQVALFLVLCVTVAGERAVTGCKSLFLSFSVSLQKRHSLAVSQQAAHSTFFVTSWSFLVHSATGQTDSTSWRVEGDIEFLCMLVSVCEHKKRLLSARGAHVYPSCFSETRYQRHLDGPNIEAEYSTMPDLFFWTHILAGTSSKMLS